MKRKRGRPKKSDSASGFTLPLAVTFKLDRDLVKRIRRHSDNQSITRTEIIERAVEKFLDAAGA